MRFTAGGFAWDSGGSGLAGVLDARRIPLPLVVPRVATCVAVLDFLSPRCMRSAGAQGRALRTRSELRAQRDTPRILHSWGAAPRSPVGSRIQQANIHRSPVDVWTVPVRGARNGAKWWLDAAQQMGPFWSVWLPACGKKYLMYNLRAVYTHKSRETARHQLLEPVRTANGFERPRSNPEFAPITRRLDACTSGIESRHGCEAVCMV